MGFFSSKSSADVGRAKEDLGRARKNLDAAYKDALKNHDRNETKRFREANSRVIEAEKNLKDAKRK